MIKMRFSSFWLFCSLAATTLHIHVAAAKDPAWDVLPPCALKCMGSVLESGVTACAPTNTTCLCTDEKYQTSVTACVVPSCTVKESLVAKRLGSRQCGVPVTQQSDIPGLTVMFALTSFLVLVRLLVKFLGHGGGWGADDWLMLLSFSLTIALYIMHLWRIYDLGLGMNTWDVPFAKITKILVAFFANEMVYIIHISCTKISVCFFFLRIFSASRTFRLFVYPVIGMNVLVMVLFIFIIVFQCKPIHLAWTGWAKEEPGRCLDIYKLVLGNGIVNIAMDIIIIGLPIYEVTKLQLSRHRKLGVILIFAMGFVLTIIGIVRCVYFWRTRALSNPTINLMPLAYWSCIETMVAIVCACLPDSRFFFSRLVPQFYKSVASSPKASKAGSYWTLGGSNKSSSRQAGSEDKEALTKIEMETKGSGVTTTTTATSLSEC